MIQFNHVHAPNKFIIRINMIHGLQKTKSGFKKRKRKRKQKLFSKKKKKTAKIQKRQNWRIKAATTESGTTYSHFIITYFILYSALLSIDYFTFINYT